MPKVKSAAEEIAVIKIMPRPRANAILCIILTIQLPYYFVPVGKLKSTDFVVVGIYFIDNKSIGKYLTKNTIEKYDY
jgi:hypothetical protein